MPKIDRPVGQKLPRTRGKLPIKAGATKSKALARAEQMRSQRAAEFGGRSTHTGPAPIGLMGQQMGVGNAMLARLGQLEVKAEGSRGPRKSADGQTVKGDIVIARVEDLEILKGVARLDGTLTIEETALAGDDLSALQSLREVTGAFNVEGNRALSALDNLENLRSVGGNIYLGFNAGVKEVSLPALEHVGGALIIEGNDQLEKLALPKLESVGTYLHVHENQALMAVDLSSLSGPLPELSIAYNASLKAVQAASLHEVSDLEVLQNGADQLQGLEL